MDDETDTWLVKAVKRGQHIFNSRARVLLAICALIAAAFAVLGVVMDSAATAHEILGFAIRHDLAFWTIVFFFFVIYVFDWMNTVEQKFKALAEDVQKTKDTVLPEVSSLRTQIASDRSSLEIYKLTVTQWLCDKVSKNDLILLDAHVAAVSKFLSDAPELTQKIRDLECRVHMMTGSMEALSQSANPSPPSPPNTEPKKKP